MSSSFSFDPHLRKEKKEEKKNQENSLGFKRGLFFKVKVTEVKKMSQIIFGTFNKHWSHLQVLSWHWAASRVDANIIFRPYTPDSDGYSGITSHSKGDYYPCP